MRLVEAGKAYVSRTWIVEVEVRGTAIARILLEGFQFVAVLAALLFAGAAIYVNLAEHPARMECGTLLAA